jgi:hypothetical protein
MRQGSRFMPKVTRRRWPGFVFLAVLSLTLVYFRFNHAIETSLIMVGVVAFGIYEHYRYRARIRKLAESRTGETICQFARSFQRRSVDTW